MRDKVNVKLFYTCATSAGTIAGATTRGDLQSAAMSSTSSALNSTSRPNSSPVSSSGAQTSSTDSGSGESMRRRFAGGATSPKSEPSSKLSIVSARSNGGGGGKFVPSAKRTDFFGAATGAGSVFSLAGVAGSETIKSDESAKSVCEQLFSLRRDGREYCNRCGGDDGGEMVRGVIVTTQFGLVVRAVVVGGDSGSSAAPLSSGIVTTRGRSPTLSMAVIN